MSHPFFAPYSPPRPGESGPSSTLSNVTNRTLVTLRYFSKITGTGLITKSDQSQTIPQFRFCSLLHSSGYLPRTSSGPLTVSFTFGWCKNLLYLYPFPISLPSIYHGPKDQGRKVPFVYLVPTVRDPLDPEKSELRFLRSQFHLFLDQGHGSGNTSNFELDENYETTII